MTELKIQVLRTGELTVVWNRLVEQLTTKVGDDDDDDECRKCHFGR